MPDKTNLLNLDRPALAAFCAALGEPRYRADQLCRWLHQRGVSDFSAMTDMNKALRARLAACAEVAAPTVARHRQSTDGTRKWLFRLADGNEIETVFIPQAGRGTLCVSSQAGCVLACVFCATGRGGFKRNLSVAEIIGQVWMARRLLQGFDGDDHTDQQTSDKRTISNIVFMGMGEPLYNYKNVLPALGLLLDDFAYGLSCRRVTVSTAGVAPRIVQLAGDCDVALAVSLHAPDDALRDQLVPLNRRYPLKVLMAACREYTAAKPGRHITMEYVMLDGINDRPEQARRLVELLRGLPVKVNLIPFNHFHGSAYRCSTVESMRRFSDTLQTAGVFTTTRRSRGPDISAACGQLAGRACDHASAVPPLAPALAAEAA